VPITVSFVEDDLACAKASRPILNRAPTLCAVTALCPPLKKGVLEMPESEVPMWRWWIFICPSWTALNAWPSSRKFFPHVQILMLTRYEQSDF